MHDQKSSGSQDQGDLKTTLNPVEGNSADKSVTDQVQEQLQKTWQKYKWTRAQSKGAYEDNPESYAYDVNIYKICWLFVFGSLAGYVLETIWYYYLRGHLVNRQGVLFGPFSPIYGVGFVMLTLLLHRYRKKDWRLIWLVSMVALSSFEYLCSFAMENILGTRAWNYSRQAFNLNGRICLKFCIMWGFLGLLYIRVFYPLLSRTIENMKPKLGKVIGVGVALFLLLDCLFSVEVSLRQAVRRQGFPPRNLMEIWIDSYYTDEKLEDIYSEIRVVKKQG